MIRSSTQRLAQRLNWMIAVPIVLGLLLAQPALAQDAGKGSNWTRFRGPNGQGWLPECRVPIPWRPDQVAWSIDLPGEGNGSPVLWEDRYYLLSADPQTEKRQLICGDLTTGKAIWIQEYPSPAFPIHKLSSFASCTPCVDESGVYAAWATPEQLVVKAFSHDGKELWSRDLGRYVSQHGFGGSPIRVGSLLILANSQDAQELPEGVAPGEDTWIALDAVSGQDRWQLSRTATRVCYGAPCVQIDPEGRTVLLGANTGDGFFAIDAESGKQLWSRSAFSKRVVSSALLTHGMLISTEGSGGGGNVLVAIDAAGSGTERFRVTRGAPYVPTPIATNDHLFLWADNGIVSCLEMPSGKTLWSERIGGNVSSSPVVLGDKLIGISQEGMVTVVSASGEFEKLGEIDLAEVVRATPAASASHLLIRTNKRLICIAAPQSAATNQ